MVRSCRLFVAVGLCGLYAPAVQAKPPRPGEDLVRADRATLDALYTGATVGTVPSGFLPGRAIPEPGSRNTVRRSNLIGLLWKGKVFTEGQMINRLAGGLEAVTASVYVGESWLDGKPSLILDYAGSKRFGDVRDEMREIAPGVYLGLTYVRKCPQPKLATYFVLDARTPCRPCCGR
jgi:hypothetical protein